MLLKVIRSYLPFFIGLIAGIYFFNLNITAGWTHLPGDPSDARLVNYLLEHAHQFITGKTPSFWNAPFLFPEKDVISYSENMLGIAPFYSLFRLLGADREISFQYWFILISALNYISCYFLLVNLFKSKYAAALGAMIFAFSIALQSQMVHAQTFPRFAIPLAMWAGAMYIKDLKPAYFFGVLFFLVYQFYCGIYLGFMLFVPITLLLLFSLAAKWNTYRIKIKEWKWLGMMLSAMLVNVGLLLPLMLPYLHRAQQVQLYSYESIVQTVPTIRSYFYSHYGSLLWEFLNKTGVKYEAFWDHQIFAGGLAVLCFLAFLCIVITKALNKNIFPKIELSVSLVLLFFTGLFTFLFFIRFQGYSLYKLIFPLPGFASMRALQRIINIELVFYAIAVAFIFQLVFRKEKKYDLLIFIFFVGLVYLDNHIADDTTDRYVRVEARERSAILEQKMKDLKPWTIISYEPDTLVGNPTFFQLDAMLAAQALGLRTLNGYTSNAPDEYSFYWQQPNAENRLRWLKKKNFSPDSVVVIH